MLKDNKHIQDFFKENIEELNVHQMSVNHEHRFLEKLEKKKKPKQFRFLGVAASIIVLLGFFVWNQLGGIDPLQDQEVVAYPQEVVEAHQYYDGIIMKELARLETLKDSDNEVLITDTVAELQQLKKDEEALLEQLSVSYNERIVKALIDNFQVRINLLETVMQKVKSIKEEKNQFNLKETTI